jgi:hypothetical protein
MPVIDLNTFTEYCAKHIKGDEKGEAQIFLDHLFMALGYEDGLKGAGAECEFRVKDTQKRSTSFADLVWKKRVLIEMKKAGEDLSLHLQQASSYWFKLAGDRPRYIILCNFTEFWIYDFDTNIYEPAEKVLLKDLAKRKETLAFLLPHPRTPVFDTDHEDVTERAAEKIASLYNTIISYGANKEDALRYSLQCIIALFAEDVELLPDKIFSRLIKQCVEEKVSSYDLIGGLFREMNTQGITPAGIYKGVDYFNGGLFEKIAPFDLKEREIILLDQAAYYKWQKVNPAIFGTIFEKILKETGEQHKLGAHYTHEIDIKKIVDPVIVQPWTEKIEAALDSSPFEGGKGDVLDKLYNLLTELSQFKVLDPACGSGNFLFVAFKEMKLLEKSLLHIVRDRSAKPTDAKRLQQFLNSYHFVNTNQFYGIDIKPFAVELAKVTLMVAKEISYVELKESFDNKFKPLPLDNLDKNIICADALLNANGTQRQWPQADAIIGNPPYQSKNKMQEEFGREYLNKLREAYPEVPGRADFCVYWYYKAHQHLKENCFAGLVGTNTIRQNYSREGSLDYIVQHGGEIVNAISTEPWSGDAAVHVSIVSWKKGKYKGEKTLYFADAKGKFIAHNLPVINSSLSLQVDVTSAKVLDCNKEPKTCFQGQTHGHEGFLLSVKEAKKLLKQNKKYAEVLKPFLVGDELVGNYASQPKRFVIDFSKMDLIKASSYKAPFDILKTKVLPEIEEKAELERKGKIKANGREAWLKMWWKMWRRREDMLNSTSNLKRYIACARVTQRPIFEMLSTDIRPNDKVMVFVFNDDYSFGIIQSNIHWKWFIEKCTTLGETPNYNSAAIWDTFPWPQKPTAKQIAAVAKAAKALRDARNQAMQAHHMSLRDLYRLLEQPGKNPIKDLHTALDKAVIEAYGFDANKDLLTQLLELNLQVAEAEAKEQKVQGPGLPATVKNKQEFISPDCVTFNWED